MEKYKIIDQSEPTIAQQIEATITGTCEERRLAMESLSTKDPKSVLDAGVNMYKRGEGEDCLTYCSFALLSNKRPEEVFECLENLFEKESNMYMLESFIPTVCELRIDDEKRRDLLLKLAQIDDKDFKQDLKDHLELIKPRHVREILSNIKSA